MTVVSYRSDERRFVVSRNAHVTTAFLEVYSLFLSFPPLKELSTGNCCGLDGIIL